MRYITIRNTLFYQSFYISRVLRNYAVSSGTIEVVFAGKRNKRMITVIWDDMQA